MALGCQVKIDHGGIETCMAQVLLDTPDVDTGLKQMGGIGMPERMDGYLFFKPQLFDHPSQRSLDR